MTQETLDNMIAFVRFNQAMEGMEITAEEEALARKVLSGEISEADAINLILNTYERK